MPEKTKKNVLFGGKIPRKRSKVTNCTGLYSRRRKPDEIPTRKGAIRNFCRECMGWDAGGSGSLAAAINDCPSVECWLYPYRNGKVDVPQSQADLQHQEESEEVQSE